jgi:hypothetical protein
MIRFNEPDNGGSDSRRTGAGQSQIGDTALVNYVIYLMFDESNAWQPPFNYRGGDLDCPLYERLYLQLPSSTTVPDR